MPSRTRQMSSLRCAPHMPLYPTKVLPRMLVAAPRTRADWVSVGAAVADWDSCGWTIRASCACPK
jgi:hypothetical protein